MTVSCGRAERAQAECRDDSASTSAVSRRGSPPAGSGRQRQAGDASPAPRPRRARAAAASGPWPSSARAISPAIVAAVAGGWASASPMARRKHLGGRVRRGGQLVEPPGQPGELGLVGDRERRGARRAGGDEGVEAHGDDQSIGAVRVAGRAGPRVAAGPRRPGPIRARNASATSWSRIAPRSATAGGGSSGIAANGRSARRPSASERSPARWRRATVIGRRRRLDASRPGAPERPRRVGADPERDGAPASASTAADSSSRSTSRSVWRTSHASDRASRPLTLSGADTDDGHDGAAGVGQPDERGGVAEQRVAVAGRSTRAAV